jgi:putative aldouronate transport system permease protein
MKKRLVRLTVEDKVLNTIVYIILIFTFIVTAYPFYLSFILSFNDAADAAAGGIYLWPRYFTLYNYQNFFRDTSWLIAFGVTLLRTFIGTILTVFFTAMVSYGLSFQNLIGRKFYMSVVILCMYFSGGLIPYYMTLRALRLLNTFFVYIIPSMMSLFYVIVAISFFQQLPQELHESGVIDGASEMKIFTHIIIPVSKPLLATIAVFTGVGHWTSWFDSAYFVQNKNLRTLGYLLMAIINKNNTPVTQQTAIIASQVHISTSLSVQVTAMVITVFPIILIYPFLQRYFVSGLTLGSVKG